MGKVFGGILLVAGTTIGAAMLALPTVTGMAGLKPTLLLFLFYWVVMTYSALLMLEVNLWMEGDVNLISMARATLGKPGEIVSWCLYLLLLYLLTTAYVAGSQQIITDFIETLTGYQLPEWAGPLPLLVVFGFFVFEGTRYVDWVNRLLMLGLAICFCTMVILLVPHVKPVLLQHSNPTHLMMAVSTAATSFGFHIIIPSLTTYMHRNKKKLVQVILIGSAIPMFIYALWEVATLGVIPLSGPSSIMQGYEQGTNGVELLVDQIGHGTIGLIAQIFSLFAIITSFLGVSLSLVDFLSDGLKVKKNLLGRAILCTLTFLPPFLIVLTYPRAFLLALQFAGAYCVMVLLAFLPALMVWSGRYRKGFPSTFRVPGGKIPLVIVMLAASVVVVIEVMNQFVGT